MLSSHLVSDNAYQESSISRRFQKLLKSSVNDVNS